MFSVGFNLIVGDFGVFSDFSDSFNFLLEFFKPGDLGDLAATTGSSSESELYAALPLRRGLSGDKSAIIFASMICVVFL